MLQSQITTIEYDNNDPYITKIHTYISLLGGDSSYASEGIQTQVLWESNVWLPNQDTSYSYDFSQDSDKYSPLEVCTPIGIIYGVVPGSNNDGDNTNTVTVTNETTHGSSKGTEIENSISGGGSYKGVGISASVIHTSSCEKSKEFKEGESFSLDLKEYRSKGISPGLLIITYAPHVFVGEFTPYLSGGCLKLDKPNSSMKVVQGLFGKTENARIGVVPFNIDTGEILGKESSKDFEKLTQQITNQTKSAKLSSYKNDIWDITDFIGKNNISNTENGLNVLEICNITTTSTKESLSQEIDETHSFSASQSYSLSVDLLDSLFSLGGSTTKTSTHSSTFSNTFDIEFDLDNIEAGDLASL